MNVDGHSFLSKNISSLLSMSPLTRQLITSQLLAVASFHLASSMKDLVGF